MSTNERFGKSLSISEQSKARERVTYYKDRKSGNTSALYTCQGYRLSECISTCENGCWHPPQLLDCDEVKTCLNNYTKCGMDVLYHCTYVHNHWDLDRN